MSDPASFPPARGNGPLREILPDLFFVAGAMRLPGPVPVRCSRSMTVVRRGEGLVLINTLRLDEPGLAALEALGRVEHVVRTAGFHGSDDAFYKHRYGATVWSFPRQPYARGFSLSPKPEAITFHADREMTPGGALPVPGLVHLFRSCKIGEGIVVLDLHGGVAVPGDALQNWTGPDEWFNFAGRAAFRLMGFFEPCNVGPGWLRQTLPDPAELRAVLELPFEHVFPAHGEPVLGGARAKYRRAIEAAADWAERARR